MVTNEEWWDFFDGVTSSLTKIEESLGNISESLHSISLILKELNQGIFILLDEDTKRFLIKIAKQDTD